MKYFWKVLCKSVGEKASPDDNKLNDHVAMVRLFVLVFHVVVGCFIVANAIHHW